MNSKNISLTIINIIVFILISLNTFALGQNSIIRKQVEDAAEENLSVFLEKIPVGMENDFGIPSRDDFKNIKIGTPMNVLRPSDNFSKSELDSTALNVYSTPAWEIPLVLNGKACCFLFGRIDNDKVKIYKIGGDDTARLLNNINDQKMNYNAMDKSVLLVPTYKKSYIVFHNEDVTNNKNKCVTLDGFNGAPQEQTLIKSLKTLKKNYKKSEYHEN
jgi:hypothetical protein